MILNNARDLNDLRVPPGNRLEALAGDRKGKYSGIGGLPLRDGEVITMPGSHDTRKAKLPPIHPGEILNEEFLRPLGITQYRLAKAIGVDVRRIHAIVHGQRAITAETALLLSRFFQNSGGILDGAAKPV
ncbi:Virulence-associated protein I [Geodia barretti]|uniref:Virulence-associated protein I n=1 Tax=Geodia barretti TaxID=519541 RepID=A0AA35X3L7_GEOBA|nr:Virulence-associated protein I [Geodia barretti]